MTDKKLTDKTSKLKAELKEKETAISRLYAERETIEERITQARRNQQTPWAFANERDQLSELVERTELIEIEACRIRIELNKLEMPDAIAAVGPLKTAYEESRANFLSAREDCNLAGCNYAAAKRKVSSMEGAIIENERRIEDINLRRLKRAA